MGVVDLPVGGHCENRRKDTFYPELGVAQIMARDAKSVCNGTIPGMSVCPVREACLEFALANKERFGIWGGKSERERATIAKARRVAAKRRDLEVAASRQRRSEAAKRAWENRRAKAVQQEQATLIANRTKETSAKSSRSGRKRAA